MEKYPQKIYAAVFLAAFIPDSTHMSSYVLNQYNERTPSENWLNTQFLSYGSPEEPLTSIFFGSKFLAYKLYQLCSPEDIALASSLIRPSSLFLEDLSKAKYFTDEGYGSVKRVYIICTEDKVISEEFQGRQIDNISVTEAKEIKGADHMAMLNMPKQLCVNLLEIADKYTTDLYINVQSSHVSIFKGD
ncbi:Salicylic acid-binding protein 2 [Datura stramonium]|uniref:Salicylic acid-binding protein 2 n=1 Tax=Datura stramonium TaxID=4076 RepID=A0ABS8WKE5_DATST|nr:Salicylic acid-binding protein 2 [Datura stramonium]